MLEDTLIRAEIAYQVIGGTKFYERAEIKDAIAYLTLLRQPAGRGVVHPHRQLAAPRDRADVAVAGDRLREHDRRAVLGGGGRPEAVPGLGTAAVKAFARFMGTMASLRERAEAGTRRRASCSRRCCTTGYIEALEAERTIEAQGRIENLEELVEVGTRVRRHGRGRGRSMASSSRSRCVADADSIRDEEGLLTLMTLHNAKGLEYPIVFIIGCEDGVFPHSRALDEGGLEEERRLAYVGITRAMRDLYLTYARTAQRLRRAHVRAALALPRRDSRPS